MLKWSVLIAYESVRHYERRWLVPIPISYGIGSADMNNTAFWQLSNLGLPYTASLHSIDSSPRALFCNFLTGAADVWMSVTSKDELLMGKRSNIYPLELEGASVKPGDGFGNRDEPKMMTDRHATNDLSSIVPTAPRTGQDSGISRVS